MVTERISASGSLPEQNEEFPWATILGRKYFWGAMKEKVSRVLLIIFKKKFHALKNTGKWVSILSRKEKCVCSRFEHSSRQRNSPQPQQVYLPYLGQFRCFWWPIFVYTDDSLLAAHWNSRESSRILKNPKDSWIGTSRFTGCPDDIHEIRVLLCRKCIGIFKNP